MSSPLSRTGAQDFDRDAVWMRRLARGLVGEHAADDVVQEAWLKVGDRDGVNEGYRAAVVRSLALRRLRSEQRRSRREAVSSRSETLPSTSEVAARLEIAKRLSQAVDDLSEPYRTTLVLRYFDGLSAAEIARRAGVPSATVRTRVRRGLESLRQRLDDDSGGRRNWLPVLLPLARRDAVELAAASSSTAVGLGVKVAVALLVVAAFGVWAAARAGRIGGAADRSAVAALAPPAAVRPSSATAPDRPPTEVGRTDAGRASVSAARPADSGPADATPSTGPILVARAVDEARRPLPDATLRLALAPELSTRADAGGWLRLECPSDHPILVREDPLEVLVAAPGRRTRVLERQGRAETTRLGEVVLEPGGAVVGRVVDESGLGVEGARVVFSRPVGSESASDAYRNARRGPLALRPRGTHTIETRPVVGRSGPGGAFHLAGLPTGHGTVWARGASSLWTHGEPLSIQPGVPAAYPDLVLVDAAGDVIAGRVVDPDGRPLPGVPVTFERSSSGGAAETDLGGAFHYVVLERAPHEVRVTSPSWEWEDAELLEVAPGTRDLEIALVRSTWFWLDVRSEHGTRVRSGNVRLVPAAGRTDRALPRCGAHLDEDGEDRRMRRPAEPFRVLVEAPGYRNALVGPFDPQRVPDPLRITLEPVPGIVGRVLRPDGRPAAGASVRLHRGPTRRSRWLTHDRWQGDRDPFVYGLFVHPTASAVTDEEGRYRLPLPFVDATTDGELERAPGREGPAPRSPAPVESGDPTRSWFVHAAHPSHAARTSGPLSFEAQEDVLLDLRLPTGGALDGTLDLQDGTSPAGWTMVASDGLAGFAEAPVEADGRFRFEHLRAGGWQVRAFEPGAHYRDDAHRASAAAPEPDVVVQVGTTVPYRHATRRRASARLVGQLRVDGEPPGGWLVEVQARSGASSLRKHETTLDADGRFEVELAPGTEASVLVRSGGRPSLSVRSSVTIVPGPNDWSADLATARLSGRVDPERVPAAPYATLSYRVERGPLRILAQFESDAEGAFGPVVVPAGPGTLEGASAQGYFSTERHGQVELAPGEDRSVDWR